MSKRPKCFLSFAFSSCAARVSTITSSAACGSSDMTRSHSKDEGRIMGARRSWAVSPVWSDFCAIAPSPELKARMKTELSESAVGRGEGPLSAQVLDQPASRAGSASTTARSCRRPQYPLGTPPKTIRNAALERAPLRGAVRVIVVLAQFTDRKLGQAGQALPGPVLLHRRAPARQREGVLPERSTNGLVDLTRPGGRAVHAPADRRLGTPTATSASASRRARRARTSWPRTRPSPPTRPSISSPTTTTATAMSTRSWSCTPAPGGEATGKSGRHVVAQVDAAERVQRRRRRRSTRT